MSIPLFAHDANPRIDSPLCYKTRGQVIALVKSSTVEVLRDAKGKEWAVKFMPIAERTLQAQLKQCIDSVDAESPSSIENFDFLLSDTEDSTSGITDVECRANAGVVDTRCDGLEAVLVLRARNKIAAWPHIRDERNLSVSGCRW